MGQIASEKPGPANPVLPQAASGSPPARHARQSQKNIVSTGLQQRNGLKQQVNAPCCGQPADKPELPVYRANIFNRRGKNAVYIL